MDKTEKLLEIMAALRDPRTGCPWDLEQDFSTIAPYTVEEAYEVADAIAEDDYESLKGELGDLLLQVVFHSQMAKELELFSYDDVVEGICDKMLRRHPHVFGSEEEKARGHVEGSWEAIKASERKKGDDDSVLAGIATAQPSLKRAQKLGERAATVGFDWPDKEGVRDKIREELEELADAVGSRDELHVQEELGDLLYSVVNLARHHGVDPEAALAAANRKFEKRFRAMEAMSAADDNNFADLSLAAKEQLWRKAKVLVDDS